MGLSNLRGLRQLEWTARPSAVIRRKTSGLLRRPGVALHGKGESFTLISGQCTVEIEEGRALLGIKPLILSE